ncbi:ATP-dependent zinc protease [uncultured Maricaulis sp.]|uniref:ATP-dependent zinc protease family protein n=1 Tax=uncultured Maricaulis sp. TaxID=174710 RepID=UPI0026228F4B|nr:ATP-dependent zinc protease [uncultured Maricaulis sp.]
MVRKTKSKFDPVPGAPSIIVGWREWVGLPELGDARVKAKIDTGARTSAIHAWKIQPFEREGEAWVRFELHPNQDDNKTRLACEAKVIDSRVIKSSNGQEQKRYVIRTPLRIGAHVWPIELTLTRRDEMGFRMLVGRTALKPGALVNPSKSYLCPASA